MRDSRDRDMNGCKPSATSGGTRVASSAMRATVVVFEPPLRPRLSRLVLALLAAVGWIIALVAAAAFVVSA